MLSRPGPGWVPLLLSILACRGDADAPAQSASVPAASPAEDAAPKIAEARPAPPDARAPDALAEPSGEPPPPLDSAGSDAGSAPATDSGSADAGAAEPEPPARRYVDRECEACEETARRCVTQQDPDGSTKALGCGEASPSGRYALVVRERGVMYEDSWEIDYVYLGPEGELRVLEKACTVEPDFDCEGPGHFLDLDDGRFVHHMGNAGDGTNEQAIADLVSGDRHPLPRGEYSPVVRDGAVAGFLAAALQDGGPGIGRISVAAGCLDVRTGELSVPWAELLSEKDAEPYHYGHATWDGDTLVLHDGDGAILRRVRCPPVSGSSPHAADPR